MIRMNSHSRRKFYSEEEKHRMIQELLRTGSTKSEIWRKYTGLEDHGRLIEWMRSLGYLPDIKSIRPNIVSQYKPMARNKAKQSISDETSFENLQLRKRVAELEKQLKDAELKAIAYSTMVDIAEKEFNIPIRKKLNTKP